MGIEIGGAGQPAGEDYHLCRVKIGFFKQFVTLDRHAMCSRHHHISGHRHSAGIYAGTAQYIERAEGFHIFKARG